MSLLTELKRRNVIRMAGLYLVGTWLLTQVSSTVLPMFGAPEWLPRRGWKTVNDLLQRLGERRLVRQMSETGAGRLCV